MVVDAHILRFTMSRFTLSSMNGNKKVISALIVLIVIGLGLTLTTYSALSLNKTLVSGGNVKVTPGLGIYADSACSIPLTSINWGNVTPGTSVTQTMYIENTGTGASLSLSLSTSNWSPSNVNGPIAISGNQEGTRLLPGQSVAVAITATISPSIADISNFNVQIVITGTQ
jgi:hypothetical protein